MKLRLALLATAILALASGALAQVGEIAIGPGLAVRREGAVCDDGITGIPCLVWVPIGFAFGDRAELPYARAFGYVPSTGRIVAVHNVGGRGGVLYTDDLGASWRDGRWDWHQAANAVAFDPSSTFGVAAGEGGYVWNTDDGGRTWRDRGSSSGTSYTDVRVLGRIAVLRDDQGRVWLSRDGGFGRDLLAEDRSALLGSTASTIVVWTPRRRYEVHRDGRTESRRPAPH
jgi:hypothetical protein